MGMGWSSGFGTRGRHSIRVGVRSVEVEGKWRVWGAGRTCAAAVCEISVNLWPQSAARRSGMFGLAGANTPCQPSTGLVIFTAK